MLFHKLHFHVIIARVRLLLLLRGWPSSIAATLHVNVGSDSEADECQSIFTVLMFPFVFFLHCAFHRKLIS